MVNFFCNVFLKIKYVMKFGLFCCYWNNWLDLLVKNGYVVIVLFCLLVMIGFRLIWIIVFLDFVVLDLLFY